MAYRHDGTPLDFNDPIIRESEMARMKMIRESREKMTDEEQIAHAAMLAKQMGPKGEVFLRRFKEKLKERKQT